MEKNPKFKTPLFIFKILLIVVAILMVISVTSIINRKITSRTQEANLETQKLLLSNMLKREETIREAVETAHSEMLRREQIALKMGFRLGTRAVAERTTSGCFHPYPPEVLQKASRKNIIEFRFIDGKSGHLIFKHWKNP